MTTDFFDRTIFICPRTGLLCIELTHKLTRVSRYIEASPEFKSKAVNILENEIIYHYLINGVMH